MKNTDLKKERDILGELSEYLVFLFNCKVC